MPGNMLAKATSPYLLQHRNNPVHWMEWGREALDHAKAENKPVLLSIGYAACHWCHVMAHESFEDDDTAAVMNALFVNIKVDREERPDVDHFYMSALHALGEQGGWPLTMFLTPEGQPFWGGTYFPKESRFGRPSFGQVLRSVAAAFHEQPDRIARNTAALMEAVSAHQTAGEGDALTPAVLDSAVERLAEAMDPVHGGMAGAPKFPNASSLEMLFRAGFRHPERPYANLALVTLTNICEGGICDHLGGGFARYSTDDRWLVPHFEKMLYDNAQLLELLALAHHVTGEPLFRKRAEELVGWLDREMTAPSGAFFSSLDADSEHVEGKFYVWTPAEIAEVLGPDDAELFGRFYDVSPAGNWHDEETGAPVTILNRLRAPTPTAEVAARLEALCEKLLDRRAARVRPGLDDKVLCDWNALAIAALAQAGALLDRPDWVARAARAFAALAGAGEIAFGPGRLVHAQREGQAGPVAFASDYVGMARAALALHEIRPGEGYLASARGWLDLAKTEFAGDTGILFMSAAAGTDVPARLAPLHDEAVPNPNGLYVACLIRLAAMTGDEDYRSEADRVLFAAQGAMVSHPLAHCTLFNGFDLRLNGAEIVLAGTSTDQLRTAATRDQLPEQGNRHRGRPAP